MNVGSKPFGVRIATRRKFNRKRINLYNVTVPNFGGFLCVRRCYVTSVNYLEGG